MPAEYLFSEVNVYNVLIQLVLSDVGLNFILWTGLTSSTGILLLFSDDAASELLRLEQGVLTTPHCLPDSLGAPSKNLYLLFEHWPSYMNK